MLVSRSVAKNTSTELQVKKNCQGCSQSAVSRLERKTPNTSQKGDRQKGADLFKSPNQKMPPGKYQMHNFVAKPYEYGEGLWMQPGGDANQKKGDISRPKLLHYCPHATLIVGNQFKADVRKIPKNDPLPVEITSITGK